MNYDPDMNYCLSCGDEYRSDFHTCGVCGEPLTPGKNVAALKKSSETVPAGGGQIHRGEPLAVVESGSLADMKSLGRELRKRGIPSVLGADGSPGNR